jgi:hypothetical protein
MLRAAVLTSSQLASYDHSKRLLIKSGYFHDNQTTHLTYARTHHSLVSVPPPVPPITFVCLVLLQRLFHLWTGDHNRHKPVRFRENALDD